MSLKTVTFSVRVSQDDAEFISDLHINGAKTPSDKIRAIIKEARLRAEKGQDYSGCMLMIANLLQPAVTTLRESELQEKMYSELISRVIEWLPELIGYIVSTLPPGKQNKELLLEVEQGVADRVFRLLEAVLRLGATERCRGYNPGVVSERMAPVLALAGMVENVRQPEREEGDE